jgi:hypothetical protein
MPDSAAKPSRESCRLLVKSDLAQFKADLAQRIRGIAIYNESDGLPSRSTN